MAERRRNQPPELRDLDVVLDSVSWGDAKRLALRLGVSSSKLEDIEMQSPRASDRKLEAMNDWLKRDVNASWEKFVETLRSLGMNPLARDVEEKYCTPAATAADKPGTVGIMYI